VASQVPTATAGQVKEGRGLLRLQTDALGVPSQAPVCAGVDEGVGAGVCVGGAGMMEGFVSLLSSNLPKPCVERIVATRLMKINTKTPAPSFFLLKQLLLSSARTVGCPELPSICIFFTTIQKGNLRGKLVAGGEGCGSSRTHNFSLVISLTIIT